MRGEQSQTTGQHGRQQDGRALGFDENRRAARREMWTQAAMAASYGDQPATSGRGDAP